MNLRSAPPEPTPPTGGSRGGSAKLYAPCIFLEPVSQVVHGDESAVVRARCVPDTPPLAGKLLWSFDPEGASTYVSVAQDKLSATVSGLGPNSPQTIWLHADVGYALTTGAIVHYCAGHDNYPTNHVSFPPNHTNATINPVFRDCEHPFYDDSIAAKVQSIFPDNANIIVVGPSAEIPQPHKTVEINSGALYDPNSGKFSQALGATPPDACHQRNDSPSGLSYVFNGMLRQYIFTWYRAFYRMSPINAQNDWRNVSLPLPVNSLADVMAQIAMHESCHAMGLVPATSTMDGRHNKCNCGRHHMDDGGTKSPLMRLGIIPACTQQWKPENEEYLEFVFQGHGKE